MNQAETERPVPPHHWAKLHRQVVFGQSGGRIIWQPRIGCWYSDKIFEGEPLPPQYQGMTIPDIHRALGCSARLYQFNSCFQRVEPPSVRVEKRAINSSDTEIVTRTPAGNQTEVHRQTQTNRRPLRVKRLVESREELEVAIWREENAAWAFDQERYQQLLADLGDLGAPTMYLPRMNVQDLYINKMGVERTIYALHDWPDTVHAFFRASDACHERLAAVINASPVDIINFGENVHSGTLSPDLFRRYHLPACQRLCELLHNGGKFVSSHWDGDCGPLLPMAQETGLDAIEAITPQPQGDVTLEQIKAGLGDRMFLIDGIPAIYFDETFGVDVLKVCVDRLIELFAPRLVLGISDEISSTGDIERVRLVGDWVNEYNAQFD